MNISTEPSSRVASFLRINGDLRRQNAATIAEQAKKEGVADLRTSGLRKVRAGITSLEELHRVTLE